MVMLIRCLWSAVFAAASLILRHHLLMPTFIHHRADDFHATPIFTPRRYCRRVMRARCACGSHARRALRAGAAQHGARQRCLLLCAARLPRARCCRRHLPRPPPRQSRQPLIFIFTPPLAAMPLAASCRRRHYAIFAARLPPLRRLHLPLMSRCYACAAPDAISPPPRMPPAARSMMLMLPLFSLPLALIVAS
jgi:hypothetical protein